MSLRRAVARAGLGVTTSVARILDRLSTDTRKVTALTSSPEEAPKACASRPPPPRPAIWATDSLPCSLALASGRRSRSTMDGTNTL